MRVRLAALHRWQPRRSRAACNDASNQRSRASVAEVPARKSVLEAPNFVTCGQSDLNMDQRLFSGCSKTSANILTGELRRLHEGGVLLHERKLAVWGEGRSPPQTLANVSNAGAGKGCCAVDR